jgi:TRAP-type C4-dicarboxylate transport system permease large subunit
MLGGLADAAVVGSALVSEIENAKSVADAAAALAARVRALKDAGRHGLSKRAAVVNAPDGLPTAVPTKVAP